MKEKILEKTKQNAVDENNQRNKSKRKFNYTIWIMIILSILEAFFLRKLIKSYSSKNKKRFWIYLISNIFLIILFLIFIIIKRRKEKNEEKMKKEEERLNEIKKRMIENQKKLRQQKEFSDKMTEQQKNQKINNVLEDMCTYGTITKKEIIKEKEKYPEKFIETSQALNMGKKR